jgi:hypothetical protein
MGKLDMRTGSTAVMILRLLVDKPMYGYQLVKELQNRSEGYFDLEQGTLYPALHRLDKDGKWLKTAPRANITTSLIQGKPSWKNRLGSGATSLAIC